MANSFARPVAAPKARVGAPPDREGSGSAPERQRPAPTFRMVPVPGLLWPVQTKVSVGAAHDPAEVEADRVARSVLDVLRRTSGIQRVAAPLLRRPLDELRRTWQRSAIGREGGDLDAGSTSALHSAAGSGGPIPGPLRTRLEPAIGADLSGIRLHTDDRATELNRSMSAVAFTHGRNVFFRDGMPDTGAESGLTLLVHELAHTVQQGSAPVVGRSEHERGAADPSTAVNVHRMTTGSVQRLIDGRKLEGLLSTKGSIMGAAKASSWDDLMHTYHEYASVANKGDRAGKELELLLKMQTKANAWLGKRKAENDKAVRKGTDGKNPESANDERKRDALADLLSKITLELPFVTKRNNDPRFALYAPRAVNDLGLPQRLVGSIDADKVVGLIDADRALAVGKLDDADLFLQAAVQDPDVRKLIKSSLMAKNVGSVNPEMSDALTNPKYKLSDPAQIKAGADKAQSLATDRVQKIEEAERNKSNPVKLAAMSPDKKNEHDRLLDEGQRHKPTLKSLKGAAEKARAAQPKAADTAKHEETFAEISDDEAGALIGYSTNLYPGFNGPLRAGIDQLAKDQAALTKLAISGLNKLPPFNGLVYRHGQNFPGYEAVNQEGGIVSDMAFLSTAVKQQACANAGEFHEVLEVLTSGTGRDLSRLSAFGQGEAEVLFKPGTRFRVTRAVRKHPTDGWPDRETFGLADATSKSAAIKLIVFKQEL